MLRALHEVSCSVLRLVRILCVFILLPYGLGSLASSDAELTSETESLVDVGYVWWSQRRFSARARLFSQCSAM